MPIRKFRLTVAYDGTEFSGFQRQPARATVQGALEKALASLANEEVIVVGAGRTDAGVHALGQVVHFETTWPGPAEKLPLAVGSSLPRGIAVSSARVVNGAFHARYSARFRRYGYLLLRSSRPDPIRERYAWRVSMPLELGIMEQAAQLLRGRRDFGAWMSDVRPDETINPVRTVQGVRWLKSGRLVLLLIQADAFLRHMVRNIVGGL